MSATQANSIRRNYSDFLNKKYKINHTIKELVGILQHCMILVFFTFEDIASFWHAYSGNINWKFIFKVLEEICIY